VRALDREKGRVRIVVGSKELHQGISEAFVTAACPAEEDRPIALRELGSRQEEFDDPNCISGVHDSLGRDE
jgi:hypothetical protein